MKTGVLSRAAVVLLLSLAFAAQAARCDIAADNAAIYNKAAGAYASKDYRTALKLYQDLIERGVKNAELFYNLGNTYYKAGKLGYAILYFERALALQPFDRDIRKNLEYTRRSLKERIRPLYNERVFAFFRDLASYVKPGVAAYAELFFFTLAIAVLNIHVFFPFTRVKTKKYLYACAALLVVSAGILLWYQSFEKNHPRGIIVERETRVLSAPIAESETLFTLYEGSETRLREARGNWVRILLADGREGWTLAQNILFI